MERSSVIVPRSVGRVWPLSLAAGACIVTATAASAQNLVLPAEPAGVGVFSSGGVQFSHVQIATAAYPAAGMVNGPVGGGNWDFGIARTEVTQGQWVDFLNALNAAPIPQDASYNASLSTILTGTYGAGPGMSGAGVGPQGRLLWQVSTEGANLPVRSVGWFGAALFCNWLSSGRASTIDSIISGAYDLRGWSDTDGTTWQAVTRSAGAAFYLPTYDEWAVASFRSADPNGQWFPFLNSRDHIGTPGAPGVGDTSFLWDPRDDGLPYLSIYDVPVGAYANSQSPWGLLDTSGSVLETLENRWPGAFDRLFAGTRAGVPAFPELDARNEQPGWFGADGVLGGNFQLGFRVATSSTPTPGAGAVFVLGFVVSFRRRL